MTWTARALLSLLSVLLVVALWTDVAAAQSSLDRYGRQQYTSSIDRPFSDFAKVVDDPSRGEIENALREHQRRTGHQIAILTLDSIEEPIEDFALRTATKWGGGTREHDNGILVVFAIKQRRSRIEVGYGLESVITDAKAKGMLDALRPELVAGDYAAALAKIANTLMAATGGEPSIVLAPNRIVKKPAPEQPRSSPAFQPREPDSSFPDADLVLLGCIALFLVALIIAIWMFGPRNRGTNLSGSGWASVPRSSSSSSSWGSSSSSSSLFGSSSSSSSLFGSSSSSSSLFGSSSSSNSSSFGSSSSSSSSSGYRGGGGGFGGGGASSSW